MSGSGAVIVMDDSRSMPWAMNNINRFYAHESCGQCTPCREGCPWMMKLSTRILEGKAAPSDVDLLIEVANQIEGKTVCAFGEAASWPTPGHGLQIQGRIRSPDGSIQRLSAPHGGRQGAKPFPHPLNSSTQHQFSKPSLSHPSS